MRSLAPFFAIWISVFLFGSCLKQDTYIRYTDLHHVETQYLTLKETGNDSFDIHLFSPKDDTLYFTRTSKRDSLINFLEGRKVVQIDSSFFIRKNVKKEAILQSYYNRDVKF